ncbi:CCA tRNA nucleotidyltransferase [Oceanibium sediminis]|uniref:CCA tRNA nucleotidyltransferase n=1 Tax=Oceanibium sediminis TaxID=2026339 RepID=UPI000DD347C9|nr:CCA tRNA nucleotidyltransferase [Oceanibium sediminis]
MTRLDTDWIRDTGPRAVLDALCDAGFEAYYVGGAVRDALLGRAVTDIDVATNAPPDAVTAAMDGAGLKTIATGIEHGTVTVLSGMPVEVTTYRRDVATDGRRATVAFSETLAEDAARRDFTLNALYADRDGAVIDPLGGLEDLRAGKVRFIGDASLRIREDGLRVLRFFRFFAHYSPAGSAPDEQGFAAIAAAGDALRPVSRERIGAEMTKLLAAPDPGVAVQSMAGAGVLQAALPGADPGVLPRLIAVEQAEGVTPDWRCRLACLGGDTPLESLRLSRRDGATLTAMAEVRASATPLEVVAEMKGADIATQGALLRAADGQALPEDWRTRIAKGAAACFPLSAADLIGHYGEGPALGAALAALRAAWRDSGFTLDRDALLEIDSRARV